MIDDVFDYWYFNDPLVSSEEIKHLNKIINERKSLKCSPFIKFENLEPICTPITDPINNMSARTISTV